MILRRYHEICYFLTVFKSYRLQKGLVLGICGTFFLGLVKLVRGRTPTCVLATYPPSAKPRLGLCMKSKKREEKKKKRKQKMLDFSEF